MPPLPPAVISITRGPDSGGAFASVATWSVEETAAPVEVTVDGLIEHAKPPAYEGLAEYKGQAETDRLTAPRKPTAPAAGATVTWAVAKLPCLTGEGLKGLIVSEKPGKSHPQPFSINPQVPAPPLPPAQYCPLCNTQFFVFGSKTHAPKSGKTPSVKVEMPLA
jgi:hypothetical protein